MNHLVLRGLLVALFLGGLYGGFTRVAQAATTVSGNIPDGTVWTPAGSPYVVNDARVSQGATLTIEPGVVVKMSLGREFAVDGTLIAEGTEEEKIYFTSIKDDTVGGDTNGDGNLTSPNHSDWQQIQIFQTGNATISHAVLRYGGLRSPATGLTNCGTNIRHCFGVITNLGTLHLSDSTIARNFDKALYQVGGSSIVERVAFEFSVGNHIYANGGALTVRDSSFNEATTYGVMADQGTQSLLLTGNTFSGGDKEDVYVHASVNFSHENNTSLSGVARGLLMSGTLVADRVWTSDSMPYISNVTIPTGVTLTIESGAVVKFAPDSVLLVHGSLIAQGTEEEKIYFTSIRDDAVGGDTNGDGAATSPTTGDWMQLRILETGNADLEHAVLGYGGKQYRPGVNPCAVNTPWCRGVITNLGTLSIRDGEVHSNLEYGLYQTGGSSVIERTKLRNMTASAMRVENGAATIHESSFVPNVRGLDSTSPQVVDATNNWWGSETGPYHQTFNPAGLGVITSGNINIFPWSATDPFAEVQEPEIDPLILQYEPILYFHEDEDFFPMNVEPFIEASALWSTEGFGDTELIPVGEVAVDDIAQDSSEDWYLAFSTPDEAKSFDPAVAKEKYEALKNAGEAVPTYYAHKMKQDGWIILQYWYFYAFNNWLDHDGRNNHEGDWESVFVFLDKETKEPRHVAFSAHLNDGTAEVLNPSQYDSVRREWLPSEIEYESDRVKSFVALGSHANYPKHTIHSVGQLYDETSVNGSYVDERVWQERRTISSLTPQWMLYEGRWGADSILAGSEGPEGPPFIDVNIFSDLKRFHEPVKWAGLDKIATEAVDSPTDTLSFENQTTVMTFTDALPIGTTVTSDQHDELITFGNLDAVNLLPRFWDFSTSLTNGAFEVDVELGYTDEEIEVLGFSEEKLSVFLYDEEYGVWNPVVSLVDALVNTITFKTTHFSRYAIGQLVVTNEPPVLDPVGDQTVGEGDVLQFIISATDPDEGDTLTYSATNLPQGATFDPYTRTLYWNTDFDDAGNYTDIEFTVTDDGEPLGLDVELITITVGDVNRAPVFINPGPQEILEDERLTLTIEAIDPDGNNTEVALLSLPERASFSTTTGEFSWRPSRAQEGVYVLTFVAMDDGEPHASSTLDVVVTVGDNPTPVELAHGLIDLGLSYQFAPEIEHSYLANLQKVPTFIEEGRIIPAIQQLEAFMQKVEMDYKKGRIDFEASNLLLHNASKLVDALTFEY